MDLVRAGKADQAEAMLRAGLRRSARDAEAEHLLGLVLAQTGRSEQAEFFLRAAVRDGAARPEFRSGLGNHLAMSGRHAEAAEAFRGALGLDADHAPAHVGLALALTKLSDLDGALSAAREALRCRPDSFEPRINLASTLVQAGRADEAIGVLREARGRFPDSVPVMTSWLITLNYAPDVPEELLASEPRRLRALLGARPEEPLPNAPDPDRRLRVGYVSGDLRTHSVSFFLEPILERRDRAGFEAVCYSTSRKTDGTTERLRALSDGWVDAAELPGDALVDRIRADRVDVLVDLAGHTNSNRVLALARRAAPVQATYLGYPATTGIPSIDYRIVDSRTDPPGGAERFCTERLVRLDPCFLCYRAPADAPPLGPLPAMSTWAVTFGSFNSMPKVSDPVLDAWAAVVRSSPGSRLILKNKTLADPNARRRVTESFGSRGVTPDRLDLLPPAPTPREHLAAYGRVDIALDTFPYNGTTTTCEAMWMGVPVVTMAGRVHAGRVGVSLLSAVGLERLIGRSVEEYAATAASLAGDVAALSRLRADLRERVARSPLCDAPAFTARFEEVLRAMWRDWCGARPA